MKSYNEMYKGIEAIGVETKVFKALFLPGQGSKLVSLQDRKTGFEWLAQAEGESYRELTLDGSYVDSECSAFDDMFPTIDPYIPKSGSRKGTQYNDHGEVCRLPFEFHANNSSLTMNVTSERLQYQYTKTVTESQNGGLKLHYRIENLSSDDFECLWAGHIMITACEGGKVVTPFGCGAKAELMFGKKNELGNPRTTFDVSENYLTSKAFRKDGDAYKYYFLAPTSKGICGYYNVQNHHTLLFSYDKEKLPYLGIWINDGSFHNMHNIALEPCTAPFDKCDEARKHGCSPVIRAKGVFEFDLEINLVKGETQ